MDKNQIYSINFKSYSIPKFSESNHTEWINYGADNLFPLTLSKLSQGEGGALHPSIIDSKSQLTAGEDINYYLNEEPLTDVDLENYVKAFSENVNASESLKSLIYKSALDLNIFGGFAWNIIWSKDKKRIAEIYHTDFSSIRAGKADSKGNITHYFFSNDWNQVKKEGYKPQQIKSFDLNNRGGEQLLYIKPYRPGLLYYPLPEYIGGLPWVSLDFEVTKFHLASVKNGLAPSLLINFNQGAPDDEEKKQEIFDNIQSIYGGADNAGKFILTFSDDKEHSPEITPIQVSDLDKQYQILKDSIYQNIIFSHRITSPSIVGISTPGSLGERNQIIESSELFHNQVIRPKQMLLENALEKVLYINTGQKIECEIQNIQPVKFMFSENILQNILDKSEMRQLIGYPAEMPSNNTSSGNTTSNSIQ